MHADTARAITLKAWSDYLADPPEHEQQEYERTLLEIEAAARNKHSMLSISDLSASTVERLRRLEFHVATHPGGAIISW